MLDTGNGNKDAAALETEFGLSKEPKAMQALIKSLCKFQGECDPPPKDGVVEYGKGEKKRHFKYATLNSLRETIRKPLSKHGLAYIQPKRGTTQWTILMHELGGYVAGWMTLPLTNDMKIEGANQTYAKRYLLQGVTGIVADEDWDKNLTTGEAEVAKEIKKPTKRRVIKPKPPGIEEVSDPGPGESDEPGSPRHGGHPEGAEAELTNQLEDSVEKEADKEFVDDRVSPNAAQWLKILDGMRTQEYNYDAVKEHFLLTEGQEDELGMVMKEAKADKEAKAKAAKAKADEAKKSK